MTDFVDDDPTGEVNTDALPPSRASSELDPWPIARLAQEVKAYISKLGTLWVEGEIASLSLRPNNAFLEIKDLAQDMRISAHTWNPSNFPRDLVVGDRVVALIKLEFWPKSGRLSGSVVQIRKVGLGELLERLERLKAALIAEGLTDPSRKQKLPLLPNFIGLITAEKSDAEKDVIQNVHRRWPEAQFRVVHTPVSGDDAAPKIIAAIKQLDADPEVDVIVIARGGGSPMDLIVFSDEALVRAAAAATTPIVSAIGHENDSPILDLVADVRASTPTDAAKKVVPDATEERNLIGTMINRMTLRISTYVDAQSDLLKQLRLRPILANPYAFIDIKKEELDRDLDDLRHEVELMLERAHSDLTAKRQVLKSLSPQSTLDRGYSVVRDSHGHVLTDAAQVKAGTGLVIRLAKGEVEATAN